VSELESLRSEISELDRRLLELLNRRLELVTAVRDYKDEAGERWIDPEREAELLQALVATNPGPLSERAVTSIFSAVLDVLKQEVAAERRAPSAPAAAPERQRTVERLAVVGTGLVGTSVALAAGRAGTRCRGFDADRSVLERAAARGAVEPASSLAEAVADAELVIVAVPVGAAPAVVREVLDAAGADEVVTDVASTKRQLVSLADPRFVPGHPVAGGATGGPARAAADLFDAATWFLTPTEASSPASVALVERFVASLGARAASSP
jgi:chorismate mutase